MKTFDPTKLNKEHIAKICDFIKEKRANISEICVNELIRDDIFPLLDKYCIVVYYPTADKENNGFHKNYFHNGEIVHFVYINTAQHKEKQIFTAAHELGHIWDIENSFDEKISNEQGERIVNRFASELLMPKDHFGDFIRKELKPYLNDDNSISEVDMIKIITATMNHFFTSYKSVIYRFYELGLLNKENCCVLWGETPEHPREVLTELSHKIAKENGYSRLYQSDGRKWINGLKERLDNTSEEGSFSQDWLQSFYDKFDFQRNSNTNNLEDTLSILNFERGVENDE